MVVLPLIERESEGGEGFVLKGGEGGGVLLGVLFFAEDEL